VSLVYEALQKAEREKERKAGTPPAKQETPVAPSRALPLSPVAPQHTTRNYLGILVISVSLIAVLALAYVAVILTRKSVEPPAAAVPVFTPAAPTPAPAAQAAPAPTAPPATTENDPRFKLTGITLTDDKFGAVINGHIVYDGYYIDGANVKKVERDRVTLESNGREILLRLF
jgi:type II secretory pathway component PulC